MVMRAFRKNPVQCVVGEATGFGQQLYLASGALAHVRRHRQKTMWASEAGGQLFGRIDDAQVRVEVATGPYSGDERSRYRYRSNPTSAQRAIEEQSRAGLLYLGEWHTHAEDRPGPSSMDDDAMKRLLDRSQLNSDSLLMLVVGRHDSVQGLGLWSISSASAVRWQLDYLQA